MSGGGGGGMQYIPIVQNSSTSTTNNIPDWLTGASTFGVNNARNMLSRPVQGYSGQMAPGMTGDQTAAGQMLRSNVGMANPDYGVARNAFGQAMQDLTPATLAGGLSGIGQYMNPYISNVVDSIREMSTSNLGNALNQTRDAAINAGAYGGSRQGVREGVAIAQNSRDTNALLANLLQSGYTQALQGLGQDAQTQNAVAQQNRANALAGGAAMQGLGTADRANTVADIKNLLAYGSMDQQTQGAQQQAAYQEWLRMQNMPLQLQQLYNQTVSTAPHSTSGTSNTTSVSLQPQQQAASNPLANGFGGAMAGAQAGNMIFPGGYGAAGGAALGGLLGAIG